MNSAITKSLTGTFGAIARAVVGEHLPHIADVIMEQTDLYELLFDRIVNKIKLELSSICHRTKPFSPFRHINASKCSAFEWSTFIDEVTQKAPNLIRILSSIVSANDARKNMVFHIPGLCMAVAVLLKERNKDMCGLQSIVSLLLYSSHVDKQVF